MEYIRSEVAVALELYPKGPEASTIGSAGIDLYLASEKSITIHSTAPMVLPTGLHIWSNDFSVVLLALPRSSSKFRLTNTLGVIDSDYQGEILLKALANTEYESVTLEPGEKFAQLLILPVISPSQIAFVEMGTFSSPTKRGSGGFGSTTKRRL